MNINRRILLIDDNHAIHADFRKILAPSSGVSPGLTDMEDELFGESTQPVQSDAFDLSSAFQGEDGFTLASQAQAQGQPFALAFVDVRMPPGWDGVETTLRIWEVAPDMQIVICTAYSDYSWEQVAEKLGKSDHFLILRKPFDPVEVQQLAHNLTARWSKENAKATAA